jgi:hypothetical protein
MTTPRHPIEILPSLNLALRLSERSAIQDHVRVTSNDELACRGRRRGGAENGGEAPARRRLPFAARNSPSLSTRVLKHLEVRIAPRELVDARNDDIELYPQLLENLPPLRRPRR